jgi:hypothetical protein
MLIRCHLALGLGVLQASTTRTIEVRSDASVETLTRKIAEALEVRPYWYKGPEGQREANAGLTRNFGSTITVALDSDVAVTATLFGVIVED